MMPATPALVAVTLGTLALACLAYAIFLPGVTQLPLHRRRPDAGPQRTALNEAARSTSAFIERLLRRRGDGRAAAETLQRAGVKMRRQDFALLVTGVALAACALGVVLGSGLVGVLLAASVPLGAKLWLLVLTGRRQRAFADQLDDSLQLITGALRAGHSLPQALASVAREAEEPTAEEFARIINESRVGRDLAEALAEAAERMANQDLAWVAQAIAINREVGGNLAEVLDGVSVTIRERGQIRRQVKALAAEGKLSALVLMLLPVAICGFLLVTNASYLAAFTESAIGYGLMLLSVLMMAVGAFWLSKVVRVRF